MTAQDTPTDLTQDDSGTELTKREAYLLARLTTAQNMLETEVRRRIALEAEVARLQARKETP